MSEVTKYKPKKTNKGLSAQKLGLFVRGIILFSFMPQRYEKKISYMKRDYTD